MCSRLICIWTKPHRIYILISFRLQQAAREDLKQGFHLKRLLKHKALSVKAEAIPSGTDVYSEKEKLSEIMLEYGIEWNKKGTHEKHKSVSEFKHDKLIEEVEALTEQKEDLEHKISAYTNAEEYALTTAQNLNDNKDFEITELPP